MHSGRYLLFVSFKKPISIPAIQICNICNKTTVSTRSFEDAEKVRYFILNSDNASRNRRIHLQCKKASNFYTVSVDFPVNLRQHEWLNASRYIWAYQTLFSSLLKRPNIGFQKFRGFRLTIFFTRVLRSWRPFSSYFQLPDAI